MNNHRQNNGHNVKYVWGFGVGLLVGGLTGAGTMLLGAPQSGKKTRAQIRKKSIKMRDQTVKAMEGAVAQTRDKAHQLTDDVHEQAGELQKGGQAMLDEQRNHLSKTLKGWGEAVQP